MVAGVGDGEGGEREREVVAGGDGLVVAGGDGLERDLGSWICVCDCVYMCVCMICVSDCVYICV